MGLAADLRMVETTWQNGSSNGQGNFSARRIGETSTGALIWRSLPRLGPFDLPCGLAAASHLAEAAWQDSCALKKTDTDRWP